MAYAYETYPHTASAPAPRKKASAVWVLIYVLIFCWIIVGGIVVFRQYAIQVDQPYVAPPAPRANAAGGPILPDATPGAESNVPVVPQTPVKIYFEEPHKIVCDLFPVGIASDNSIEVRPSATEGGWYKFGASPGDPGNAIISGHNSLKGKKGTFSVLKVLNPGDRIAIEFENGEFRFFEVMQRDTYKLKQFPAEMLETDGESRMTLITCLGDWDQSIKTSASRVVAVCKELPGTRILPEAK